MNSKLFLSIAGLSLLLAPGCGLKRKKSAESGPKTTSTSKYDKVSKKSVFDEDVDSFVLEEDQNPFTTPKNGETIKLVDDASVWSPEKRQREFEIIYFDWDRYQVRTDQKAALDRNADKIKKVTDSGAKIMVEGHACKFGGSANYNMALSEKRARSVKSYLVKKGVAKKQLKVVGRGSEMCVVQSGTKEQQAPNRRVEFYTLKG